MAGTQNITLDTVVQCIARDPVSWKNISLLTIDPVAGTMVDSLLEKEVEIEPGTFLFKGKRGETVVLGLKEMPDALKNAEAPYCWINNIAAHGRVVQNILTDIAAVQNPALQTNAETGKALSILIVEDDPMTSQLLTQHLKKFGTVIRTANAHEAVANYMVERPDIIFLDIHYKGGVRDGFDVLQNLLSTDKNAIIIMISGDRTPETIIKALNSGARGFIAKPFHASDLTGYITRFNKQAA